MSNEYLVQARHLGGHRVWLRFNDGLEGELDLGRDLRGDACEPLRDERYFATFSVDDTLVWANGADFAPEFLYERVKKALEPRHRTRAKPKARRSAKHPTASAR